MTKNLRCDIIYGVDPNEDITPVMVRDAIVECFFMAHKEILDNKDKYYSMKSEDELHAMKHSEVVLMLEEIMEDNGDNYSDPDKDSLMRLIGALKKVAAKYRAEEVIQKHAGEIMTLIGKL